MEDRMGKVREEGHDEALGSQLERRRAHERVVGMVRKRRRRIDPTGGSEQARQLRREWSGVLVGLAALRVEKVEVDRSPDG
jgi:hypothetical protein